MIPAVATSLKDAESTFEDGEHSARPLLPLFGRFGFELCDSCVLFGGCGRHGLLLDALEVAHEGFDFARVCVLNVLVLFTGQRIT